MTDHVYLMGVHGQHDSRPPQLLAIFSSHAKASAYVKKHTVPVEDGDGRKVGTQFTGVLTWWNHYELHDVPFDPE